ncbi:MAG: 2-hydroxyacid dehydrogenase [Nitrososphaerales archaeon]
MSEGGQYSWIKLDRAAEADSGAGGNSKVRESRSLPFPFFVKLLKENNLILLSYKTKCLKPKIFVTRLLPKEAIDKIHSLFDATVWEGELPPSRSVLLESVKDVDGLLCLLTDKIDAEMMDRASKLRVISNLAVGYDNIDIREATNRKIVVTNTPGILTETTADYAFALMLATARRILEANQVVREGKWKTWDPMILLGQDVHHSTLGIVGLGRIGYALAKRAKGFDMKIMYYDPSRNEKAERELGIEYVTLEKLLSTSDFISIHTDLNKQTFHLISKNEFQIMKKDCILVNTARGSIVDNKALYEALKDGKISGAALDVTEQEPIPPDDQLLKLKNIIITPHIASASVATRNNMANLAVENLRIGLEGRVPAFVVNPEVLS